MRKVDGWRTLATKPVDQPIDPTAQSEKRHVAGLSACVNSSHIPDGTSGLDRFPADPNHPFNRAR